MLKKPGLEELVRELERDYARWEQVYMAGSKDPFWPDGVNANLCRNHILCGKKRIRELYPDAEMPEIYYRPLPQKLPAEYMARKEEIRSVALRSYTRYISDENFCFIRNHVERIPETDALRGMRLSEQLEKLYAATVPAAVREYLGEKNGTPVQRSAARPRRAAPAAGHAEGNQPAE